MQITVVDTKFGNQTVRPGKFYYEAGGDCSVWLGAVDKNNACLIAISVEYGSAIQTELPNEQYDSYGDSGEFVQIYPSLEVIAEHDATEFFNVSGGEMFEFEGRKYLKICHYEIFRKPGTDDYSSDDAEGGVDFETGEFREFAPNDYVSELETRLTIKLAE